MARTRQNKTNSSVSIKAARFGHIPGIPVGKRWENRRGLIQDHVHPHLVAGIYGSKFVGAYSVVLSGKKFFANEDHGETFVYCGSGGRESGKRSGPQVTDQTFDNSNNASLMMSAKRGKPVRVVRTSEGLSQYSPQDGLRYDGLYTVSNPRLEMGPEGFKICKFDFTRCPGQPPLPIDHAAEDNGDIAARRKQFKRIKAKKGKATSSTLKSRKIVPVVRRPSSSAAQGYESGSTEDAGPPRRQTPNDPEVQQELACVLEDLNEMRRPGGKSTAKKARRTPLITTGRRVCAVLENKKEQGMDVEDWRRRLWTYVASYLPGAKDWTPEETERAYHIRERKEAERARAPSNESEHPRAEGSMAAESRRPASGSPARDRSLSAT